MAQARAAVVAGQEEARVAEAIHDLDHVLGHDAKAVIDEIGAGLGQRGVAVAAQIGENHVIMLRKPRGDGVPQARDCSDCRAGAARAGRNRHGARE